MIVKRYVENQIIENLTYFPAVALVGPRQVGKTTLVKMILKQLDKNCIYLDLESFSDLQKLKNAEDYLNERADKVIILDEIQREPHLFPLLRSVIDKKRENGRFILLGSASPELLAKSSETLAGRIAYVEMHPLGFEEIKKVDNYQNLWLKGGYPAMFFQQNETISFESKIQFIQTYIERELPILGLSASPMLLRNLLRMIAHIQGNLVNYSDLSRSLGIDQNTVKRYIDYFENAFLVRRLEPYFFNISKRIVKAPKIYIRDSGLLHSLSGIENSEDLEGFSAKGNSWESFVIQNIILRLKKSVSFYFYRTQDGTELDLVLVKGLKPILGIEIKYSNAPKLSRGNTLAMADLGNIPLLVVTPSVNEDYKISDKVTVTSFERVFVHLDNHKLLL